MSHKKYNAGGASHVDKAISNTLKFGDWKHAIILEPKIPKVIRIQHERTFKEDIDRLDSNGSFLDTFFEEEEEASGTTDSISEHGRTLLKAWTSLLPRDSRKAMRGTARREEAGSLMGEPLCDIWDSLRSQTAEKSIDRQKLHKFLVNYSLWRIFDDMEIVRFFSIKIYISDSEIGPTPEFFNALRKFADALNLCIVDEMAPEIGSFFKQFLMKTVNPVMQEAVEELWENAGRAIDLAYSKQDATILSTYVQGAKELLKELSSPNMTLLFGQVLVIKQTSSDGNITIIHRTLSRSELLFLQHNPFFYRNPHKLLDALATFKRSIDSSEQVIRLRKPDDEEDPFR